MPLVNNAIYQKELKIVEAQIGLSQSGTMSKSECRSEGIIPIILHLRLCNVRRSWFLTAKWPTKAQEQKKLELGDFKV